MLGTNGIGLLSSAFISTITSIDAGLVDYRDNQIDAGTRDVLVHIVDSFQDHFSEHKPTTTGFIVGKSTWKSLGVDDEFKAKDEQT